MKIVNLTPPGNFAGLNKLRARCKMCTQRARKDVLRFKKLSARKLIKTLSTSTQSVESFLGALQNH